MGYYYRFHLHTEISAKAPASILDWLAGTGSTSDMLAALPTEEAGWLTELTDGWRDYFNILLEPRSFHGDAVVDHRLMISTIFKDDDVMVTYGLPAALAPYVSEGLIGMCWTDQQQASDPTLFLVQGGRLYLAERYKAPQHLALNGTEELPWRPFRSRDPEAER